jgi:hypothetical protein
MAIRHVIEEGDSIIALSERYGLYALTIWKHADNRGLRARRSDMTLLVPGDVVVIPDREQGSVAADSGKRHRYRRQGIPAMLRVEVLVEGAALASRDYELVVNGVARSGVTDDHGVLEEFVPASATRAILTVGEHEWILLIGHLAPVEEVIGVQQRLANLGYDPGAIDGMLNDTTSAALARFQRDQELRPSGEPDAATRSRLLAIHDRRD